MAYANTTALTVHIFFSFFLYLKKRKKNRLQILKQTIRGRNITDPPTNWSDSINSLILTVELR